MIEGTELFCSWLPDRIFALCSPSRCTVIIVRCSSTITMAELAVKVSFTSGLVNRWEANTKTSVVRIKHSEIVFNTWLFFLNPTVETILCQITSPYCVQVVLCHEAKRCGEAWD